MDVVRVVKLKFQKKTDGCRDDSCLQTGNGPSLRKKAIFFFILSILLTLTLIAVVLYEPKNYWKTGLSPVFLTASLFLLSTLIGGMIFFQRNIIVPLQNIDSTVQEMAEGRLDRPVRIKARDELGQVGERINDLAINIQEVLLHIWNHAQQNSVLLDNISEQLNEQPDTLSTPSLVIEDIVQVRRENEDLKDIVSTFSYFEVKLENEKMMSDPLHNAIESNT